LQFIRSQAFWSACRLPGELIAWDGRPVIIATFCAFALYPLAVVSAHNFAGLVVAFIIVVSEKSVNRPQK